MSEHEARNLGEWLTLLDGRRSECPSPELLHRARLGELAPPELEQLDRHTAYCPACAAEQHLVALFEASDAEIDECRGAVDRIVEALERNSPVGAPRRQVGRRDAPARGWWSRPFRFLRPTPAWVLAAAALMVVLGVTLERMQSPPPLPAATGSIVRGARVEELVPAGDTEVPGALHWRPVAGAQFYRVVLAEVDDTVLWEDVVSAAQALLPQQVRQGLRPMVTYRWKVEALDQQERRIASSEWADFRVMSRRQPATGRPERGRGR